MAIFTLHFEISCFGVRDEYLQRVNYISASEVYISDDRYIHRVRGFVEGEVLTNEFEMVENVFGATRSRARTASDGHPVSAFRKYFRDVDTRYVSLSIRRYAARE